MKSLCVFLAMLVSASVQADDATAAPQCPGDYNQDGSCVDAADYVAWRKIPNQFGGDPGGYDTWRYNFGQRFFGSGGGDLNGAAVPEPSGPLFNSAPPGCDGDYNGDGACTDAADYVVWRKLPDQFGDKDGYDTWRENFGETSPGAGGSNFIGVTATPEPSGLLLAIVGGFAGCAFTARRRRTQSRYASAACTSTRLPRVLVTTNA